MSAAQLVRNAVEKRMKDMEEAANKKDWKSMFSDFYATNAKVIVPSGETLAGADAIVGFMEKSFNDSAVTARVDEVNGDGDWAFARGTYKIHEGGAEVDVGKYLTVWKKTGDVYKIYNDVWNSSRKI